MKVLWVSHFLPYPPTGGNLQRSHFLLREAARRHEVEVVALNQRANLPTEAAKQNAVEQIGRLVSSIEAFDIPSDSSRLRWYGLVARSYFRSAPYAAAWFWNPRMAEAVRRMASERRYDLIHLDTIGLWRYGRGLGLRLVLNHHNIESQMMARRSRQDASLPRRLYFSREARKLERMEKRVAPLAAMNLVVSALDEARLDEISPGCPTRVVDNGVDVDFFQPAPGVSAAPGSLVFVSSMNWYPNADAVRWFLRDIWPRLSAGNPHELVTFVGRDPPAELVEAARDPRIRVTGFVDDVRPYMDSAEIYVCPIRDGGGTRLKILDALAMAKPIVATRLAVEGLGLEEDVHYVAADTPDAFVDQIRRLRGDHALRARLGMQGRRYVVERYSWARIGSRLEEAYQAAAEGPTVS